METGESASRTSVQARPTHLGRELAWGALAGLVSLLAAAWRVGAPGTLGGLWGHWDYTTVYAGARTLADQAWITPNYALGFPFVQDLAGFPSPDIVHILTLKLLAVTTGDPLVATNSFLLLSFAVVAAAGYALFRVLRIPVALAFALSVSLALVPWHFERFQHSFLANYSSVLLGLILVIAVLTWNLTLGGPDRGRTRDLVVALALACYVGLTGSYYAVFITILALASIAFQVLLGRRGRALIPAIWLGLLPLIVTQFAAYSYRLLAVTESTGGSAFARSPEESQLYAGALFTLLRTAVPWSEGFPIPGLSLVETTASSIEADAGNSTVGLVAVIVAFAMAGMVLMANARPVRPRVVEAVGFWPWLFLTSILFFVVGGFGQAFSVFFLFQIRSWGRFAIVIIAIAYVILGLCIAHWVSRSQRPSWIRISTVTLVLVITAADLVSMQPPFDPTRSVGEADELRDYGAQLDGVLPADCGVYELPAYRYPEGKPTDGTATYDPLLPYLFAAVPRWSYGGIRGTVAGDWHVASVSRDTPTLIEQAKAAGFCAIQVDGRAFAVESSPTPTLRRLLGEPIAESTSGRWTTFSLDSATAGPFTTDYLLEPVAITPGFGMVAGDDDSARTLLELGGSDGTLLVANPGATDRPGVVEFEASSPGCPATLTVSGPGQSVTVPLESGVPATVRLPFTAAMDSLGAIHLNGASSCLTTSGSRITIVNPRFIPG